MINIASLVSYTIFPARTGGQKGIALFTEYYARHCRLTCITVKSNDPSYAPGYTVLNIIGSSAARYINPFLFFRIRRIIREQHITRLQLEHPYYGWLGIWLKKATGVRLIIHSHNIEATRWKSLGKWWWKILYYYERMTHRAADYNFFKQAADMQYALREYGLQPEKCIVVTYGIGWEQAPSHDATREAKKQIRRQHGIAPDEHILLFNGAFGYKPNLDALEALIEKAEPLLRRIPGFSYKILVCGIGIPEAISQRSYDNIIIAGFAEDVSLYFKAADVFLNPIVDGGGIKTKLVEALGYNANAVSTVSGATGVDPAICNGKLTICPDYDWEAFASLIAEAAGRQADIGKAYFDHFAWNRITERAVRFVEG